MLTLPKEVHQRIASEFRFAASKMAEAPDLSTKTYYFSAFYGELQRALNYDWSDELSLVHMILQTSHQTIKGRIDLAIAGVEPGLGLPSEFAQAYTRFASDMASLFERPEIDEAALYRLLARAAALNYSVTGNGYYLYLKGVLSLSSDSGMASAEPRRRQKPKS